jgi:type IV secretory pathway ATPase VirB11/archaellum biosynthesis ATPase
VLDEGENGIQVEKYLTVINVIGRRSEMAWRLQEVSSEDVTAQHLTDEEMLAVFVAVRDSSKQPFDETNPLFRAYLKISTTATKIRERLSEATSEKGNNS